MLPPLPCGVSPVFLICMFAPPTWLPVVVYLSYVAAFASRFFASTTCTAPVRLLWLVVRGCLRCLPPQFQCLSINLVPRLRCPLLLFLLLPPLQFMFLLFPLPQFRF